MEGPITVGTQTAAGQTRLCGVHLKAGAAAAYDGAAVTTVCSEYSTWVSS